MVQIERSKVDIELARAGISSHRDGTLSLDAADGARDCQLRDAEPAALPDRRRCFATSCIRRELAKAQVGAAHASPRQSTSPAVRVP